MSKPVLALYSALYICVGCTPKADDNPKDSGLNPTLDSDGDGYTDLDEVDAGTDPNDASSVIYVGGWPYNANKDQIDDPGWDSEPSIGATLPHFIGIDQFGEQVDFYDFAGQGVPIALDLSTVWCSPCNAVAEWLDGQTELPLQDDEPYIWWDDDYSVVRDMVDNQEVIWITVLYEDNDGENATVTDAEEWYAAYPHELIPVIADEDKLFHSWIKPTGIPNVNILDEDMKLLTHSTRGLEDAFILLVEMNGR